MARFAVGVSLFLAVCFSFPALATAQTDPGNGVLPFSTKEFGVDLASGHVVVELPLRSKSVGGFSSILVSTSYLWPTTISGNLYWSNVGEFAYQDPSVYLMSVPLNIHGGGGKACCRCRIFPGGGIWMSDTEVAHGSTRSDLMRTLRFAGKFLLAVFGIVAGLWTVGATFGLSRWAGFALLAAVVIVLYLTVPRWVGWLPGLLVFGVLNSLLGLVTHHAPTNPDVVVSTGVAGLLLAFYAIGCIVSYNYDATRLSAADRLALLVYLFCMIWPGFAPNNLATMKPIVAWSTSIGMAALIASFASHRARVAKRPKSR